MSGVHRTPEWYRFTRRMRPLIEASLPQPCVDCSRAVMPGQKFDVGHRLAASQYPEYAFMDWNVGPSHSGRGGCNQAAGGRMGAAKTNKQRKRRSTGEFPNW